MLSFLVLHSCIFFFNDTATTEIYTLSLHDALPISPPRFRLFFYDKRRQARSVPTNATIKIETVRPDGARQTFTFRAKGEYLESEDYIPEPHEFKAIVRVSHGSHTHPPHEVQFSEHKGRQ